MPARLLLLSVAGPCSIALVLLAASTGSPAVTRSAAQRVPVDVASPLAVAAPLAPRPALVPRASRGGVRTALVPVGPAFTGSASWYGGSFQGKRTANGERFDTRALTAASRTLAFGTRLRVCRARRCVVVRINDRGPYVGSRVLDLSHAAAQRLGYEGVEQVTATPVSLRRVTSVVVTPALTPVVHPDPVGAVPAAPAPVLASRVGRFARPASGAAAGLVGRYRLRPTSGAAAGAGLVGLVGVAAVRGLRRRTVLTGPS